MKNTGQLVEIPNEEAPMEPRNDVAGEGQDPREWELSDAELDRTDPVRLGYCTCGPGVSCSKTLISRDPL